MPRRWPPTGLDITPDTRTSSVGAKYRCPVFSKVEMSAFSFSTVTVGPLRSSPLRSASAFRRAADGRPAGSWTALQSWLRCARNLLCDPARFWEMAAPEHRPRLQDAIYPNGLEYDGRLLGTAETSLAFSYLRSATGQVEGMVSPTGLEPVLPP